MFSERFKQVVDSLGINTKAMVQAVGFSEAGFYKMLRNNSMKVCDMERFCEFMRISPSIFWDQSKLSDLITGQPPNFVKDSEIEYSGEASDLLAQKDQQIRTLQSELLDCYRKLHFPKP
jgi:predicted DNA-binding transcriptional regulator AlpA